MAAKANSNIIKYLTLNKFVQNLVKKFQLSTEFTKYLTDSLDI